MAQKQKFRKSYVVVLDKVPVSRQGELYYDHDYRYTTTYVLPSLNVKDGLKIDVPVTDFLLGQRFYTNFLSYSLSGVDHPNRVLTFKLIGLKTIPLWKNAMRLGPHEEFYYEPLALEGYVFYSKGSKRIPKRIKTEVRRVVMDALENLKERDTSLLLKILSGKIGDELIGRINGSMPDWIDKFKGVSFNTTTL